MCRKLRYSGTVLENLTENRYQYYLALGGKKVCRCRKQTITPGAETIQETPENE